MARFTISLVPRPDVAAMCQAELCGGFRVSRVHPIPRRFPTWGGTRIHPTGNLLGYPAIDFGGDEGTPVVAVERGYIRAWGSADQGEALNLRGDSGVDYWYGHIRQMVSVGQTVLPGQVIGRTVKYVKPEGRADHLHLGANTNIKGERSDGSRPGTNNPNHPTWKLGVAIMQEISRAPRVR
jgi:murein DD-endopeptidase MepM/ murein hydrolase activator NlpD